MNRLKVKEFLLPCPFCRGNADTVVSHSPAGFPVKYIRCKSCFCRTEDYVLEKENKIMISVWNSRVESRC